jgi:hypothetical protein
MGRNSDYVYGSLAEKAQYAERPSHDRRRANRKKPKNRNGQRVRTGQYGKAAQNYTYAPNREFIGEYPVKNAEDVKARKADLRQTVKVNREILQKELNMRKNRRRVRIKYFLMTGVLFIVFVAMIYRYSMVIEINNLVAGQKTVLNSVKSKAGILKKDIGRETDLEKIRSLAEDRLNMQKPDTHQYIYINVPRKDHALLRADTTGRRQGDGEKASLRESINEIIDRIWFID